MKTLALLVAISIAPLASAHDNAAFVAFAKANADRYKNEVVQVGVLTTGSKVTLRGKQDVIDTRPLLPDYDADRGAVVFGNLNWLSSVMPLNSCRQLGTFVGQNAFGVKVNARRETCERVVAFGNGMTKPSLGSEIKLTPAQYREIKRAGLAVEIDFTIGSSPKGVTVEYSRGTSAATRDEPVESDMKAWMVYGTVTAVRWLVPGAAEPIEMQLEQR